MPHPQAGERQEHSLHSSSSSSRWACHPMRMPPRLSLLVQPLVNPRTDNKYYVTSNNVYSYSAMLRNVPIRTINAPSRRIVRG